MSKFEYQKNNTTITQFVRKLTMLCENELCEEVHERILGKMGTLYKDKAVVFLVCKYADLIHDGIRHEEFRDSDESERCRQLHEKWAEQAYEEAHALAWIIAEMLY